LKKFEYNITKSTNGTYIMFKMDQNTNIFELKIIYVRFYNIWKQTCIDAIQLMERIEFNWLQENINKNADNEILKV